MKPNYFKLWLAFATVTLGSLAVLGYYGVQIWQHKPPVPERVVDASGRVLMTGEQIQDGQSVWQSIGGQQLGSVWGHGSYVAPDWSADYVHREALFMMEQRARATLGRGYAEVTSEQQAAIQRWVQTEIRRNDYDEATRTLTLSPERTTAVAALGRYYGAIFGRAEAFPDDVRWLADAGKSPAGLREAYAIATDTIKDPARQELMNHFFFWAAWSCSTSRPGLKAGDVDLTYTSNWPYEPLVGNRATGSMVMWSLVSFVLLLAGIGALVWYRARAHEEEPPQAPATNPFAGLVLTPSMRATLKYFWVVAALIVVQVVLGAVTAHYGVEGKGFYGIPLAEWLPYSVTRTWHTQIGIFWIATAWLATGLFIGPAVSGYEPKFQRLGVNFLFGCLLVIVVGTLFGTWYATRQRLGLAANFWFGHQGLEYVDLGRFWQLFLFVGLFLWLGLVVRSIAPALRNPGPNRHLLVLFLVASGAIGLFYGAGLMWGQRTHLAITEYWRWWVVHLWVEGFFEVFATVVITFLFTRLGLLRLASATAAVIGSCTIFLFGGIIGTMHHLYFTGTPLSVLALGAVFSALEVVPLTLVGLEAAENMKLLQGRAWLATFRWPVKFFVAVAFWNLVGAGVFGFLINPPIALYYMQGLNTTAVHGHTALFGVYGMLGIGLMLFTLRLADLRPQWNERALNVAYWSFNAGLVLMVVLSLLPIGVLQTIASIDHGTWYARSAEFLAQPFMATLRWWRTPGDVIFGIGALALGWFVCGLWTGWSKRGAVAPAAEMDAAQDVEPCETAQR
ncbi:MAG: nitric-oxide reductase large subunit [Candidatus Didemnitutus sp.]|nr:nitric-oxide reductase large subunit [Candidatus Didemnitutus sp.]